jgi:hypothetical protein
MQDEKDQEKKEGTRTSEARRQREHIREIAW